MPAKRPSTPDWLEQVWMEVQDEIDLETKHPQQSWPEELHPGELYLVAESENGK